jgi:hypothetical protein
MLCHNHNKGSAAVNFLIEQSIVVAFVNLVVSPDFNAFCSDRQRGFDVRLIVSAVADEDIPATRPTSEAAL